MRKDEAYSRVITTACIAHVDKFFRRSIIKRSSRPEGQMGRRNLEMTDIDDAAWIEAIR